MRPTVDMEKIKGMPTMEDIFEKEYGEKGSGQAHESPLIASLSHGIMRKKCKNPTLPKQCGISKFLLQAFKRSLISLSDMVDRSDLS